MNLPALLFRFRVAYASRARRPTQRYLAPVRGVWKETVTTMPLTAMICALALGMPSAQDGGTKPPPMKNYENKVLDLKFQHPADWRVRKERLYDTFEFRIDGTLVRVQLLVTQMSASKDHWQKVNLDINSQNGRQVLRQWEEELLNVPLLMTKVREGEPGNVTISLSGLLLSVRPDKLLFRLYAPENVADQAEAAWFKVLLSADSLSGKLPSEAPVSAEDPKTKPSDNPPPVVVLRPDGNRPGKIERAPNRVQVDASSGLFAYLPSGWETKDGRLVHSSGLSVSLGVTTGEEALGRREYLRLGGSMLKELATVGKREELEGKANRAGSKVTRLTRNGSLADGKAVTQWIAFGFEGGYSWVIGWSGSSEEFEKQKTVLSDLADRLSVIAQ